MKKLYFYILSITITLLLTPSITAYTDNITTQAPLTYMNTLDSTAYTSVYTRDEVLGDITVTLKITTTNYSKNSFRQINSVDKVELLVSDASGTVTIRDNSAYASPTKKYRSSIGIYPKDEFPTVELSFGSSGVIEGNIKYWKTKKSVLKDLGFNINDDGSFSKYVSINGFYTLY